MTAGPAEGVTPKAPRRGVPIDPGATSGWERGTRALCPDCGWSRDLKPGESATCNCGLFTWIRRPHYSGGFRPTYWTRHEQGDTDAT